VDIVAYGTFVLADHYTSLQSDARYVEVAGDTMTGDLSFGDNDKAIFGDGSDLQIYHDGSHSYISDQGTGRLYLRASNDLFISDAAGAKHNAIFTSNGAVDLRYDGSQKLATTNTGVDITGTLTSDGLTVDQGGTATINLSSSAGSWGMLAFGDPDDADVGRFFYDHGNNALTTRTAATNRMQIAGNGDISFYEDTGTTPKFFWDASAESLGIGTTSPSAYGAGYTTVGVNGSTMSGVEGFVGGTLTSYTQTYAAQTLVGTKTATPLVFVTNDNQRMRIDSSGNVGIGTSSPAQKLHVNGGQYTGLRLETTNALGASYIDFGDNSDADVGGIVYWHTDNSMRLVTNAAEAMRIDSSGNLLVGTTSGSNLATGGGTNNGTNIVSGGGIHVQRNNDANVFLSKASGATDTRYLSFYSAGSEVGSIGVAGGDLYISGGSSHAGIRFDTNILTPVVNGTQTDATVDLGYNSYRFKDAHFSGTVNAANFNTTSDATLKTNVETLSGSLDAVTSLRGVSFDWLENGGSEIGVIAQEVEAVLPDVVSTNDEGIKSVKYGNMVAVLIEAIKEQQAQIDELKAQLNS
jgi:hypothetical protein